MSTWSLSGRPLDPGPYHTGDPQNGDTSNGRDPTPLICLVVGNKGMRKKMESSRGVYRAPIRIYFSIAYSQPVRSILGAQNWQLWCYSILRVTTVRPCMDMRANAHTYGGCCRPIFFEASCMDILTQM